MMIMPIVTGARKDFRENVSRPNQISLLLPPAKRHLRLNLDTKWKQKSLSHKVKKNRPESTVAISFETKMRVHCIRCNEEWLWFQVRAISSQHQLMWSVTTQISCLILNLMFTIHLVMITSMMIIWLKSTKVNLNTRKALPLPCCQKSLSQASDYHKAFDNCNQGGEDNHKKATEKVNSIIAFLQRDRDGEFLGIVGLSLKNAAYQYFCCRVVLAPSADMYYYPFTTE